MSVLPRLSSVAIAVICMAALAGVLGGSTAWFGVAAVAAVVFGAAVIAVALQRPRAVEVRVNERCCQMALPVDDAAAARPRT